MTPDEVRMLDNKYALLFIRGERPVMDFKYDILRHPNVSRTADGKADPYKHGKEVISLATVQFDEDLLSVKHNDGDIETGDFVILTEEEIDEILSGKPEGSEQSINGLQRDQKRKHQGLFVFRHGLFDLVRR